MADTSLDLKVLGQWIGRSEQFTDTLDCRQADLLMATLDRSETTRPGQELPPLWHWIYFLSGLPQSQLGRDGHPALGGFLPPVALPRRMWAGSRVEFLAPARLGGSCTKTSTVKDLQLKEGRSGTLCFVTVLHTVEDEQGEVLIREEQDIVYREDPSPDAPSLKVPAAPENPAASTTITPTTVQLFRYSALTFNGHRIHYDREYCQTVEGYPGLVFHGPLTATLLAQFAGDHSQGRRMKNFSFRAISPLFDTHPITLAGDGDGAVWAANHRGELAMKADVVWHT